jgi:hypothetical protein
VQKALKEGKTLNQMKPAKLLAPWKKHSGDFVNEDTFLENAVQLPDRTDDREVHQAQLIDHAVSFIEEPHTPCA